MVPPAPPISLLSSRPSRRALPQIVAHKRTQAQTIAYIRTIHVFYTDILVYMYIGIYIYDGLEEKANNRTRFHIPARSALHFFFSDIFFAKSTIFSKDI